MGAAASTAKRKMTLKKNGRESSSSAPNPNGNPENHIDKGPAIHELPLPANTPANNNKLVSLEGMDTPADSNDNLGRILLERDPAELPSSTASFPKLKIWLGTLPLERKLPTPHVLTELLYGSASASAEDADVIALLLTDLILPEESVESLQHLLLRSLRNPQDYISNEDDKALVIRYIPVQQARLTEHGQRFVSLAVAVRRTLVPGDGGGGGGVHDCFPVPVYLTCKSPRKNEVTSNGKAVIVQDVVLRCGGAALDLVLLGANLDSDDKARQVQVEALSRLLRARQRERPFAALMWGDLNNRLVAFEELQGHVQERDGKWELTDSGVELLAGMIDDPERRRELLRKDALHYAGTDASGRKFQPSECNDLMLQLFSLHVDAVLERGMAVPLPSYRRSPPDYLASRLLGCRASSLEVVLTDQVAEAAAAVGGSPSTAPLLNSPSAYFGWQEMKKGHTSQRAIKEDSCDDETYDNLYLQLGWLDGVGIYKGSTVAATELLAWETDAGVQAFDHLPVRALVSVDVGGEGKPLRVWLCSLKLERRHPTPAAMEALLYGSASASAEDADVIALNFTDLEVSQANAVEMRHLLHKALRNRDDYLTNEDDGGLVLRHIPAQLVAVTNEGQRYMTLSVAVHKRNVQDTDDDGDRDNHDCFPVPVYLTCKSPRKNEVTACGKALIGQDVIICKDGKQMDLVLLGANLDTDDQAKQAQLTELQRLLKSRKRERPFCALMWGDLNNRLVAFEELKDHVQMKGGKYELMDSGVELLAGMIDDPERRRELLRKDVLLYKGRDLSGREFQPAGCNSLLRRLFTLHVDAVEERGLAVPLPSYKRSPLDELVSMSLGYPVRFEDMVCAGSIDALRPQDSTTLDSRAAYFGWEHRGTMVQRTLNAEIGDDGSPEALYLHLGWPAGIGVYKGGTVMAELQTWETDVRVQAYDHLPTRGVVHISKLSQESLDPT